MQDWQSNPDITLLTNRPIPILQQAQLEKFSQASMHVQQLNTFDAAQVNASLAKHEGKRVLAADYGGDKGTTRLFKVTDGGLQIIEGYTDDIQGNDGQGYVDSLKRAAKFAQANNIPFGISWGGPMQGTKVEFHPKAKLFLQELDEQFAGDLANISPYALNDGPAGLISGAVAAYQEYQATNILFSINGGGLGFAATFNGAMYDGEPGHIEALSSLNKYNQTIACGVYGAEYICLERLGANKAGIEAQWQQLHDGAYMRARDIEDQYKAGDTLAGELYEHSALIISHLIQGSAQALGMDLSSSNTVIVGHGGAYKFPFYGDRVQQILEQSNSAPVQLLMTKDYSDKNSNACLDGAAIAAITT